MPREDAQLNAAKGAYRNAKAEGNRQEEARWANVVGDILKNRGEYVEALKWLRIDYEVSVKYLPEKDLLATCQSLGEVYLRLAFFKDALIYQKKHLELAKDANDLIEQQRASTQLGRTYHEMFLGSENDHYSVRNAKKYFKLSMKLAKTIKENPPTSKSSFLKEYIDAHNNIGMLEMDLDNLEEAQKTLIQALEICDEEEVSEDDDGRSRLHHNLGSVYMELRMWNEAQKHIEKDIMICKKIRHCQGEAKGYINLGELHYKVQKYDDAVHCYQKALNLARSMEDEDALATQIDQNIETVKQAMEVMDELKKEEQTLKKLMRDMVNARGTPCERKCLLQQNSALDRLIEKSSMIFAWMKHHQYAKRKKRIASELCDKEKLSDSYLVIGESYQKLRKFKKALKWYMKSWDIYKSIGNSEGQALAKINIGDVLDCDGKWNEALDAFEESYRIAVESKLPSVQLSALENMHYSHMIRFDNIEEARRLQILIDQLKNSNNGNLETPKLAEDCCSETDTEANEQLSDSLSDEYCLSMRNSGNSKKSLKSTSAIEESDDDITLISLLRSNKSSHKMDNLDTHDTSNKLTGLSSKRFSKPTSNQETVGRLKRVRVILSDDEGESSDEMMSKGRPHTWPEEGVFTSNEYKTRKYRGSPACKFQDISTVACKCPIMSCDNVEESTGSHKSRSSNIATQKEKPLRSTSNDEAVCVSNLAECDAAHLKLHPCGNEHDQFITFKIDNNLIHVEATPFITGDKMSISSVRDELACLYYIQLPMEKRSEGLLPVIRHLNYDGRGLESLEIFETQQKQRGNILTEAVIDGWVSKPLIKLYVDYCKELSETVNMKLLKRLYNLEASDDEVAVSECDLQDISISPLLNALHTHKTFAVLDLSHNLLGNGTMEKLQQVFTQSSQTHDLTLDLHCNRLGPTALFQICQCPILFARLEVLNVSGNRLTDACGSYLSTILKNCKGLWSLNIEHCSITSRTIQKITDALDVESALEHLCIGYNNPISGNSLMSLLIKLSTLNRFARLNLNGLKLSKPVIDSLCQLIRTSCFSELMLEGTGIGNDAALQITKSLFEGSEEFVKLNLSYCGLTSEYLNISLIQRIHELNLARNPLNQEGSNAMSLLLTNPHCCLRVLILNKCQLGLAGILQIIQSLAENRCLEELNLACNADYKRDNLTADENTESLTKVDRGQKGITDDVNQLEVADSEDEVREEAVPSGINDTCASSYQRNIMSTINCQFLLELSTSIGRAKSLKFLDFSKNGFSTQSVQAFYNAWSSSRTSLTRRHIEDGKVHLLVDGIKCCLRPCCRKN